MGKTSGSGNAKWIAAGIAANRTKRRRKQSAINIRLSGLLDPEVCRKRRYDQLKHEQAEAKKLQDAGYVVYSPTVVCDRIAVKDGKVFFVEFKRPGQNLRPGQQAIQELLPDNYIIQFGE